MVEINESERIKEKRIKRNEDNSETSRTMLNAPTFGSYGSQKKKTNTKGMRKFLRR